MSAALLHRLNEAGVMLWWDGQTLRYRAPRATTRISRREAERRAAGKAWLRGQVPPESEG